MSTILTRLILNRQHPIYFRLPVISFLFFISITQITAQEPNDSIIPQTDTAILRNTRRNARVIETDSSRFEKQKHRIENSDGFYTRVKHSAGKNFFSKQLYPLLFRRPKAIAPLSQIDSPSNLPFVKNKGDVIRNIRVYKAEVFGSSVFDTTIKSELWLDKNLNRIHFYTHDAVIRSYIQVKKGDLLDPLKLSDNERLIRQSALFEDARFIVTEIPGSDSVDLVLVVRDVFPVGFDIKITGSEKSAFRLYNRNIMGLGYQIEQSVEFNTNEEKSFFFSEGAYKARNIRHSFTDARIYWQTRPDIRRLGLEVSRPFLTPETRFGGGLNMQRTNTWLIPDIRTSSMSMKYELLDVWTGYSAIINRYKSPSPLRSQAAIRMRYYTIHYIESPSLLITSGNPIVSVNRYIAGFSLLKSGYFRSNMVFGYGRTEDIPYGHLAEITGGYETSILAKRYYTGIRLIAGRHIANAGYLTNNFQLGGFWKNNIFSDGIVNAGCSYISRLLKTGSLRIRNYLTFSYISGINRRSPGTLSIGNSEGNNIFNKYEVEGNQRLTAHGESVVFTPFYLLGFRFATYIFTEAAMIAPSGKAILSQPVYPAIGCGLRIKNENLVFSTFQFGFTWYFRPDMNGRNLLVEFTDLPQVEASKFNINAPEFESFR